MSKIGRKPIFLSSAKVDIKGNTAEIKGPKGSFNHDFPEFISVEVKDNAMNVSVKNGEKRNMEWGLHRALLANKVKGVEEGFTTVLKIVGLGFKAQVSGKKMNFTLGYSHKLEYTLPDGVEVATDKPGQILTVKSIDKFLLGKVCDDIKALRRPEPYKGTGIMIEGEHIRRKAGKAKAA